MRRNAALHVDVVLQQLCDEGLRVFFYLDDLTVMARTWEWVMFHAARLILHLHLGFTINCKKSNPHPLQQEYLGVVLDSHNPDMNPDG